MNRRLVAVVVALLLVASVGAPTGLALDAPTAGASSAGASAAGASTAGASTAGASAADVGFGVAALDVATTAGDGANSFDPGATIGPEPVRAGVDDGDPSVTDDGPSRDDVERSVAPDRRGPSTVAGPLRSKLPASDAAVGPSTDDAATSTSDDAGTGTADGTATTDGDPTTLAPDETVEVVVVSEPGRSDAVADAVAARGGHVGGTYADHVAAELPAGAIAALAKREAVQHVREPAEPIQQGTISEGVGRMRADELHDLGATGENATIAVIDVAFDPTNEKIADQIVATKTTRDDSKGFRNGTEGLHGTASAEAVADVAPDANLVLVSIRTDFDMREAANYVENETDADAVTMSLGWFPNVGPLDGTDHLSQRIETSRERGLVWVTSAGNQGEYFGGGYGKHYDQRWTPHENHTDFMDFGVVPGRDTALPIHNYRLGGGDIYVSWYEDTSGTPTYKVVLYGEDSDGNLVHVTNSSTTEPYEKLSVGSSYRTLYVEIQNVSAQSTHHVDVHTSGSLLLHPAYTVTRSTLIPATSSDVITVAAVDQYDDRIAAYSSRGPTVDGRQGIDVAAPTNVSQLDPENHRFTGTSAAAPHVGGLAGLLAGAVPNATAADLRWSIETSGRTVSGDRATVTEAVTDVSTGSGHVDAMRAIEILDGTATVAGNVTSNVTGVPVENATITITRGGQAITAIDSTNGSYNTSLDAGVYDLEATAPDYQNWTVTDVGLAANTTTALDGALQPEDGRLRGTVTNETGAPVENATVGIENSTVVAAETNANGSYSLEGVPTEVEKALYVRKRAYTGNRSVSATLAPNGSAVRNISVDQRTRFLGVETLETPATATAEESFSVTGTVVNLGEKRWNDTVEYQVNDSVQGSENVELNATNVTMVTFEDVITQSGTYKLSIGTDNETVSDTVSINAPEKDTGSGGGLVIPTREPSATADVSVVSASVTADGPVAVGDAVTVDVRLHNAGDADGSIDLELTADGDRVASTTATVPAGASADATLSASFEEPGTYALAVDGTGAGTVEVRRPVDAVPESENETASDRPADAAPADETPGFGVGVALLAVLLGTLAARRSP